MNFGFCLEGYSVEYHDYPTNAGVRILFVKNSLAYRVENMLMVDTPGCKNLCLQFDTNSSNTFAIRLVYRRPNSNYKGFQDKLDLTIAKLSEATSKFHICGDFNIDL